MSSKFRAQLSAAARPKLLGQTGTESAHNSKNLEQTKNLEQAKNLKEPYSHLTMELDKVRDKLFKTNRVVSTRVMEEKESCHISIGLLTHIEVDKTKETILSFFSANLDVRFMLDQEPLKVTKNMATVNPLVAGAMIKTEIDDVFQYGSLGWIFCENHVLTAAHCVARPPYQIHPDLETVPVLQGDQSRPIGSVMEAMFKPRNGLDVAIIKLNDGITVDRAKTINPSLTVSPRFLQEHEFQRLKTLPIHKVGYVTGHSTGFVVSRSSEEYVEYPDGRQYRVEGILVRAEDGIFSSTGDSGAACFAEIDGEFVFIGTIIGAGKAGTIISNVRRFHQRLLQ